MGFINQISIKDFRVISELEYSPRQINIITGRNNTGKSALLDAITLNVTGYINWRYASISFEKPIDIIKFDKKITRISSNLNTVTIYSDIETLKKNHAEIIPEIYDKLLESQKESLPNYFKEIFENKNFQIDYIKLISDFFDFLTIYSDFGYSSYPYKKTDSNEKFYLMALQKLIQVYRKKASELEQRRLLNIIHYSGLGLGNLYLKEDLKRIPITIMKISHGNKLQFGNISEEDLIKLEEFIREHNLIKGLKRLSEKDVVYQKDDKLITIPISSHGDGFIALLNTYQYLLKARDGILLIEEPENHLHPRYVDIFIENLFTYCPKLNIQVFITTHSYDLILDALEFPETEAEKDLLLISKMTWDGEKIEKFDYTVDKGLEAIKELYLDLRGI